MPERLYRRLIDAPAPHPVARRHEEYIDEPTFRARVADWMATFAQLDGPSVALYQTDGLEFAATLLGAWQAGKTVWLPGDNLPATCRQLAAQVSAFAGEFPADYHPLTALQGNTGAARFSALKVDLPAVVVFTSGSTGQPSAIPKRLRQLAAEVATLDAMFGAGLDTAEVIATVSHQHIYGLLFKILWPLLARRPFLAHSLAFPEELAAALAGRSALLVASPAHLKRLPDTLTWPRAGLRAVFSSGGPLPLDGVLRTERLLGQTPTEIYGSSETGGIAWRRRVGGVDEACTPFPNVTLSLADGCLAVSSPHLPDDAPFTTADRASLLPDGRFLLAGRADRIAKIEGKRVSLDAIEQALLTSPWVAEARVLPLADGREQLAAVVVPSAAGRARLASDGKPAFSRQLRALLAESTERVALPRRWRFVDALPINAQGKTTEAALAKLFSAPTLPRTRVLESADVHVVLELTIPADLIYFDGHFIAAPVLPGVTQVDWAIHYGRQYFAIAGAFLRLEAVKFQRVIQPGRPVRLELDWRAEKHSLAFKLVSDVGQHASGRVVFEI